MRTIVFRSTGNLGDNVQALALARLLGAGTYGFFRDQSDFTIDENGPGVASGFLLGAQWYNSSKTFFSGVWYPAHNEAHVPWLKKTPWPVGARDPVTLVRLANAGVAAQLVGCVSMTLPKHDGPRSGEVYVDLPGGPGAAHTHSVSPHISLAEEWALAKAALDLYASSTLVHTTRMHVALPCLALGTPVRYVGPRDDRTSILDTVGVPQGRECLVDVDYWRELYVDFLERNLGIKTTDFPYSETKPPVMKDGA